VKLLLDTHTLLWAMRNNPKLSQKAQSAIANLKNESYVSVISVWEAATKYRNGKLSEAAPLVQDPARVLSLMHFTVLPLQLEHARLAGSLVSHHKDLFDRMLAAQALLEGLTLVSNDAVFDSMLVTRLW
jgi:PIN domain nuclease of toxin-antitoxin system